MNFKIYVKRSDILQEKIENKVLQKDQLTSWVIIFRHTWNLHSSLSEVLEAKGTGAGAERVQRRGPRAASPEQKEYIHCFKHPTT